MPSRVVQVHVPSLRAFKCTHHLPADDEPCALPDNKCCMVYIDDIVIFFKIELVHLCHFELILAEIHLKTSVGPDEGPHEDSV